MSDEAVTADSVEEAPKRRKLVPRQEKGWRGYARYRCPECGFAVLQNPRQPDARAQVEAHITEVHG